MSLSGGLIGIPSFNRVAIRWVLEGATAGTTRSSKAMTGGGEGAVGCSTAERAVVRKEFAVTGRIATAARERFAAAGKLATTRGITAAIG